MKPMPFLRTFLALAGSALLTCSHSHAASGDWNVDNGGNWNTPASWTSNPTVPGTAAGDVINFTNNITNGRTITIETATTRTVGSMTIGDSDNTHGFTIARAGTGNLVLDASSGNAVLVENGSINDTISSTVRLDDNLDVTTNGSLTISGGLNSISRTITKLGAGSLTLSANNSNVTTGINGTIFDVQAGSLVWNNVSAMGTSTINLNGGNLDASSVQNGITASATIHNWNQNWTWVGSATSFGIGTGSVTLGANGGNPVQVTVSQNLVNVGGVIGDGGNGRGLTKAGNGTLVLSAANTYTGTTTVTGGSLRLGNVNAIAGGIGVSGGLSALTINGGAVEIAADDFSRNLGTGASQFRITGGTSGFSSFGSRHTVTINNNASQEVQWGSTHFAPTALVLNNSGANSALEFRNGIDLNGADRNINVNANTAEISGVVRNTTGTAGLVKDGAGTLVLSGINAYNGTTTVNAGVLGVASTSNLPGYTGSGNVIFNGGTVRVTVGGSGWTTGQVGNLLSNATKTSGAIGLDTSSGDLTQWTAFTGGGNFGDLGLEKSGANTLTLDQVNSYTGATTISGGTLRILNNIGLSQTLSGALNTAGPDVTIHSDYNGGSGTLSTTFGALNRPTGSTVNFSVTGGTPGSNNVINTTGAAGFVGIGTYYNGKDFAWRDSSGGFIRAAVYGTDTGTSAANALTASTHALMTSNQSFDPGGNRTLTSLKITGGADLTFTANFRLITSSIVASGGDSIINMGGAQLGGGTDLAIRVDGSTDQLTIPGFAATTHLTKSGAGKLVISANAGHTGSTYVNGGTLEFQGTVVSPNVDIASGATLIFNSGSAQSFGGSIVTETISGGGNLVKNGTATLTISSPTAFTGTTTISGGVLQLGNSYALSGSTLDTTASVAGTGSVGLRISNGITNLTLGGLSGNKDFASGGIFSTSSNNYGNIAALTLNPGAGASPSYSGAIANGAVGMILTKTGQGTQILSGTNTYTGATTIEAGTLRLSSTGSTHASSAVTVNAGGALGGDGTVGGSATFNNGSIFAWNLSVDTPGSTSSSTASDSLAVSGNLVDDGNDGGSVFKIVLAGTQTFADTFWNASHEWTNVLTSGNSFALENLFTSFSYANANGTIAGPSAGTFSLSGSTLSYNFTAIPEPTTALAGLLLTAGLLRRRRA